MLQLVPEFALQLHLQLALCALVLQLALGALVLELELALGALVLQLPLSLLVLELELELALGPLILENGLQLIHFAAEGVFAPRSFEGLDAGEQKLLPSLLLPSSLLSHA